MLLIFLDTETTGLDPQKHRTLEIAFRIFDTTSNSFVLTYESLVHQVAEIWAEADPMSLQVNGFTWEMNLKGKMEKNVAAEIMEELTALELSNKGGAFICQNPAFDKAFFNQLISPTLQESLQWPYHWLDLASMYWAYRLLENPNVASRFTEKDLSKDQIAAFLHLPEERKPHRALQGVNHLITCYEKIFVSEAS